MDDRTTKSFRAGATVAVALALAALGTFLIGREQRFWESKVRYEIRFARTNGLRIGAIVSLTGVDVGNVDALDFPVDPNASYISVKIRVTGRSTARIREDTIARIRTIGLLGDKYVELSGGSPQTSLLAPGAIIPSADPIDLEALLGESGDIVTNVVEVTSSLRDVLAAIDRGEGLLGQLVRNREQGVAALGDLQKTLAHVEATTAAIEHVAKDVENGRGALGALLRDQRRTERLIANLDRAASAVAKISDRLEKADGTLPQLVDDRDYAHAVLGDLRSATRDLAELSAKANRGNGTVALLVNDPTLYRDTQGLVSSAGSSWLFSPLRGLRALFPPYSSGAESVEPTAGNSPTPAVTPGSP